MSYRIVADTNILVSATFWGGQPQRIMKLCKEGTVTLLTTSELIDELKTVLSYAKFERYFQAVGRTVNSVVEEYGKMTEMVSSANLPDVTIRDMDDMIVLTCAIGGQADYIVTGDDDLLILKEYGGIPIVTPVDLLKIIAPPLERPTR
jgi:uncharacterized protein